MSERWNGMYTSTAQRMFPVKETRYFAAPKVCFICGSGNLFCGHVESELVDFYLQRGKELILRKDGNVK